MVRRAEMSNREKIRYLKQYKYLDKHIDRLILEEERLRARAERMTPTISDLPKGDATDAREDTICKLIELSQEINRKTDEYVDLGRKICKEIEAMTDETSKIILYSKYIKGMTWEQIAVDLGYRWRNVHYLHTKALKEFKIM
jgi:DNA-directed RNA polymerase specialized sigma subunit